MLHHCEAKQYTFALKSSADFKAKIIEHQFDGMLLNVDGKEVWTKLIGEFNAYNLYPFMLQPFFWEKTFSITNKS